MNNVGLATRRRCQRHRLASAIASIPLALLLAFASSSVTARVVHSEQSLYQHIIVTESGGDRCLLFSKRREKRNQSCRKKKDPKWLVFPYTRMMLASLLLSPQFAADATQTAGQRPLRLLVVGLGGGSIPDALRGLLPSAHIDVVEIDPAVATVAAKYFKFKESDRMKVHVADARVFVKRALRKRERAGDDAQAGYDLILLDAFTGDYIPEHLMTREFLMEAKSLLNAGGVIAANTFMTSRLYDHESVTYQEVFGSFFNLKTDVSLNRIVLGTKSGELPDRASLDAAADALARAMSRYRVEIRDYPAQMKIAADWDEDARPLTDQYAPANLLKTIKREPR